MTDWASALERLEEVVRAPSADPRIATLLVLIAAATLALLVLLGVLLVTRPNRKRSSIVEDEEGNRYELERTADRIETPGRGRVAVWVAATLAVIAVAVAVFAWSATGP